MNDARPTFYEFFAGGGMARVGLGAGWRCLMANDIDPVKCAAYADNFGADHLARGDVAALAAADLPDRADLAWASFPCQDLSLAGERAGMGGGGDAATRSGTFWPFWRLIETLRREGRAPPLVVLENVTGILTANGGGDFCAIVGAFARSGYRVGAVAIDAACFVPQSRPRVFFLAADAGAPIPAGFEGAGTRDDERPPALIAAHDRLSPTLKESWTWWRLARPAARSSRLIEVIEDDPADVRWRTDEETATLLGLMAPLHADRVEAARRLGVKTVGGVYRRTRPGPGGVRRQRAEVRFDGVAGCLRTPGGGSSRQTILVIENGAVRSRLLSAREAARLMGLPDSYRLPAGYTRACHVLGDGVCPPVVRHLARHLLEPLVAATRSARVLAAE
ncbi:MAG: DNA cytosine methyltransferase [Caulobacteraceae bacterium]